MKKLTLFSLDDVEENKKFFVKQNAFIKPDGTFYLAKGYSGNNHWHQVESSALWIGRQMIGRSFIEDYIKYFEAERLDPSKSIKRLFDKRDILIHYYGLALFCRTELTGYRELSYAEISQVPDPKLYQKEITKEQLTTLRYFFTLNEDQNISTYDGAKTVTDTETLLKLALNRKYWKI